MFIFNCLLAYKYRFVTSYIQQPPPPPPAKYKPKEPNLRN